MLSPVLVRFLNRGFQPHLDQMQHGPVDDPASHRLHKLDVRNRVKVAAQICVDNFAMPCIDQLMDVFYGVQCAAVPPIGVLFRLQVGLEYGFEYQNCCRFHCPVADGGHP